MHRFPSFITVISLSCLMQLHLSSARSANLKLNNNGYDGVVIAIHEDVLEDDSIITNIRQIFSSSSSTLYNATKNRAFFRDITILIPPSWPHKPEYQPKTRESFDKADVRVAPANKKYGNTPYVKTFGGCGDDGEYMHFTPEFVVDEKVRGIFGDVGRVVVHEWGHFRWGLQEEYPVPDSGDQKWYFSTVSKKFEAVRCSLSMKGRILQVTGVNRYRICKLDNGLPDSDDCDYFPGFKIDNPAKVSLMDRQGTKGVDGFCEHNAEDEFHEHNREAPSRMNRLCGGKSAWEVMMQHRDFKNGNNQPADMGDNSPKPNFKLVQAVQGASKCRLSLVLDVSGSMKDNHKLEKMNKGLQKLILYTLPNGTKIGTSFFSKSSNIRCGMREITDEASRHIFLKDCLPKGANGGTSIGSGLIKGVDNLGTTQGGDRIILLTDGEQNTYPGPTDKSVVNKLNSANVFVDAISFTAAADKSMVDIARTYGGNYYFDSDNVNTNSLNEAFGKNPCGDDDDDKDKDIPLISDAGEVGNGNVIGYVNIDASIGRETKFIFDYTYPGKAGTGHAGILVMLTSPNGTEYTEGMPQYKIDTDFLNIVISIDGIAESGKWKYEISNESNKPKQGYKINVYSKSRNSGGGSGGGSKAPLTIKATVKSTGVAYPAPMVIYAEAKRGNSPVLGLKVIASIDCPPLDPKNPPKPKEMELLDNGIGADAKKNDGVYSRYFATFTQLGRYSFSIRVSNPNGTAKVREFNSAGGWGGAPAFDEDNLRPMTVASFEDDEVGEDVSRTTTAGASELQTKPGTSGAEINRRLRNNVDEIPPAKIEDLVVMETNFAAGNVTLAWTATGDNYDEGRAGLYTITISRNVTSDKTFDAMAKRGSNEDTVMIQSTVDAGERETVILNVVPGGDKFETLEFKVAASDDAGNTGEESNAATAGLGYVADIRDGKLPFTGTSSNVVVIVVVVVVVVLLLVVIALIVVVRLKGRNKGEKNKPKGKELRGVDNQGMVQVQVHSIDTTQQFKYSSGKDEVKSVTKTTSTTTTSKTTKSGHTYNETTTTKYVNRK